MKNLLFTLATLLITTSANAMGFEQAREQALFLTDKMAYELNLTDDQYEAAYEINLDYLLGINHESDLFGPYWINRNLDMSYILTDWQYRAYCDALYFYRPIYWGSGYWHFRIFARYPHRTFFYFSSRPAFYHSYRGAHSWHAHGGSWYRDRHFGAAHRPGGDGRGMKDHFHSGTRNHGMNNHGPAGHAPGNRDMNRAPGNRGDMHRTPSTRDINRTPSTRDVNRDNSNRDFNRGNRDMNRGNREINRSENREPSRSSSPSFQQRGSSTRTTVNQGSSAPSRSGSFGGGSSSSRGGGSFSGGGSHSGGSRGAGGHTGGRR